MSSITITCPHCGGKQQIDPERAGSATDCSACGRPLPLPRTSSWLGRLFRQISGGGIVSAHRELRRTDKDLRRFIKQYPATVIAPRHDTLQQLSRQLTDREVRAVLSGIPITKLVTRSGIGATTAKRLRERGVSTFAELPKVLKDPALLDGCSRPEDIRDIAERCQGFRQNVIVRLRPTADSLAADLVYTICELNRAEAHLKKLHPLYDQVHAHYKKHVGGPLSLRRWIPATADEQIAAKQAAERARHLLFDATDTTVLRVPDLQEMDQDEYLRSIGDAQNFLESQRSDEGLAPIEIQRQVLRWLHDRDDQDLPFQEPLDDGSLEAPDRESQISQLLKSEANIPTDPTLLQRMDAIDLQLADMDCTLRGYQSFAVRFMLAQRHVAIGDQMGLGKTIQILALCQHLYTTQNSLRALIAVPASLRDNWLREARKRVPIPTHLIHGSDRPDDYAGWRRDGGIAVVSYSTLARDVDEHFAEPEPLDLVVMDEAHYIKNPETLRTQAARRLAAAARHAVVMTGTPIENHPTDFFEIVNSISHKHRDAFASGWEHLLEHPDRFRTAVHDIYLRRNKDDVLHELPELIETEEWITPMRRELQTHLQLLMENAHIMTLRQHATLADDGDSTKIQRLHELVDEVLEDGEKIVIFSYFSDVIAALHARYPNACVIQGSVPHAKRTGEIDRFATDPSVGVCLAQIVAGGVGLNLQMASVVIIVEPQFNPALEDQAIARLHRMGQRRAVRAIRFYAKGTIEEGLIDLLERKRQYMRDFAHDSHLKDSTPAAISSQDEQIIRETQQQRLQTMLAKH